MKQRLASILLTIAMVLTLVPYTAPAAQAAEGDGTIDAFGIRMYEWTQAEKKKAEGEAPFGVGYGTKTSLITRSELYLSMGYDKDEQQSRLYDWNSNSTVPDNMAYIDEFIEDYDYDADIKAGEVRTKGSSYVFAETAAMDLNNSGRDEYIAVLAYHQEGASRLDLYVTDTNNQAVTDTLRITSGNRISQLDEVDTYEIRGTIAIAAGDFDGDGVDTIVVYIPTVGASLRPYIAEYKVVKNNQGQTTLELVGTFIPDVFDLLGIDAGSDLKDLNNNDLENQPMVSLVAEDTDKDGFDELVITAGMNDVDGDNENWSNQGDARLGSQLFVYERTGSDGAWESSFATDLNVKQNAANRTSANTAGRVVWASATVGNILASTSTTNLDYPEIVAAGFVDGKETGDDFRDIEVDGDDPIGVSCIKVSGVADSTSPNVQCNYSIAFQKEIKSNGFTRGGFYEGDAVNSLLQVEAFAYQGTGGAEALFISGTIYYNIDAGGESLASAQPDEDAHNGSWYTPSYFRSTDDWAGDRMVSNAIVQDVVAGNFDGNEYGQEQLIFVTGLRQRGYNKTYSQMYVLYNGQDLSLPSGSESSEAKVHWHWKRSEYLVSHRSQFYITLNAVDIDNDSTIVTLKEVQRGYSEPNVLAILESTPYFSEIGDGDTGNGQTLYGTSQSEGSGSSNTFGFSAGVMVGYETELLGGGFETTVDNSFNWGTANTTTQSWSIEYANDTGDNLVVVYRCPVVSYLYVDQHGNKITVSKTGVPATSMIPVDDYNEAAGEYGLEPISESSGIRLAEPGNPQSYRSSISGAVVSPDGWVQYSSQGTTTQTFEAEKESENSFTYGLDVSITAWGNAFGWKAGVSTGFSYEYSTTSINGSSVTKSGSVTGQQEDGYDFQWRFAAWTAELNGNKIPVLGYLVNDVSAPPSPVQDLSVETINEDSVTLAWESGIRAAQQYRIYRVLENTTNPYVLVGAVDGTETSYTLTGLEPGKTYTYVVRGAAYEADGTIQESVNSAPVTLRTRSANAANVEITLTGVGGDGVLHSSGASAALTANVSASGTGTISYNWQLRDPDGRGWTALSNGTGNEGLGSVAGAGSSLLTLTGIDRGLDGAALRCVVTVTSSDATPEYYYSPIAPLSLSGNPTTTELTVTGHSSPTGTTGTISAPYTGLADYTTSTSNTTSVTVQEPVTVTSGETEYTIYSYAPVTGTNGSAGEVTYGTTVYLAVDAGGNYYKATRNGSEGNYTYNVGEALTTKGTTYHYMDNGTDTVHTGLGTFDGVTLETATAGEGATAVTYTRVYLFENGQPQTEYWSTAGTYYTRNSDGNDGYTYTEVTGNALQALASADLRMVYQTGLSNGTIIVDRAETKASTSTGGETGSSTGSTTSQPGDGYDQYEVYTPNEDPGFTQTLIWAVPDTGLYARNAISSDPPYADRTGLTAVIKDVEKEVEETVTTQVPGTQLTLTAVVKDSNSTREVPTTVDYVITNTTNGGRTTITTIAGNTSHITWQAPSPGLYQITATAHRTGSTLSSSATCYYYARFVGTGTEYRLLVLDDAEQITSAQYAHQTVTLTLQSRTAAGAGNDETPGEWTNVQNGVTYTAALSGGTAETLDSGSYTIPSAGNFCFTAQVDGVQVAAAQLEVTKRPITLSPTWDGMDNATTNVVPENLSDISIAVTSEVGLVGRDTLTGALAVSCGLYGGDGESTGAAGVYPVTLVWTTETVGNETVLTGAAQAFQSKYEVTLASANLYSLSGGMTVNYTGGENGTLSARYVDLSGSQMSLTSGGSVPRDYSVVFTAIPHSGFVVDQWTINGVEVSTTDNATIATFDSGSQTLTVYLSGYGTAVTALDIAVSFANSNHTLTFSVGTGDSGTAIGTIAAASGGNTLTSPSSVAHGASVTFTATPDEDCMVEYWQVDGARYTWPGTEEPYREHTLTLEGISADHTVTVFFTAELKTAVHTSVVDTEGNASAAASISVADTSGNTVDIANVPYDTALVFTANLTAADNTTVREWQTSTDGETWTTVAGSGNQTTLTIYAHALADLYVRAVVDAAQTYPLSWSVAVQGGGAVPDDADASLTAAANGAALTSGANQPAYIAVDFTLTLSDAWYVVGWSDNVTSSGKTASLASLTADTTVTVTIAKKPTVTINAGTNGSVTVTGTVNGKANTAVNSGGYVDYGTGITVTLTPNTGYVVGTMDSVTPVYTDGDGSTTDAMTYTIASVTSDQTITPAWTALDQYAVTYSVVDTNGDTEGGTNGTLSAAVSRKNMDAYQVNSFTSGNTVYNGSTVTFTAAPHSGYRVQEWTVNGTKQTGDGLTYTGTTLELTADGADSATPYNVQVTFVRVGANTTVTAGDNGSITAAFVSGTDVLANIATGFTTNVNAIVSLTAQPNTGYEVAYWAVNGQQIENTAQENTYSYTVTGALTGAAVTVVFQPVEYQVSWDGNGHSTVTAEEYGTGANASIRGGTSVTFTAVPHSGYVVSGWTVNGAAQSGATGSNFIWTVPTGAAQSTTYTVRPTFSAGTYTVTIAEATNGTLTANVSNLDAVAGGTSVTFTATPNAGYQVSGWTVNNEPVADNTTNRLTITVQADTTVAVAFVPTAYAVTYSANNSNGTVTTPSGASPLTVTRGGSVTFTATPNQYYMVSGWTVTGTTDYTVSADRTTLTLNSVDADISVTANFSEAVSFAVGFSVNGGSGGALSATDDGTAITPSAGSTVQVTGGSKLVFTAAPTAGGTSNSSYMVAQWTVNNVDVTRDNMDGLGISMEHYLANTLTVPSIAGNLDVKVTFETYEGFALPTGEQGVYTIREDVTVVPASPEGEVRRGGDVTFTVEPAEGLTITSVNVTGGTVSAEPNSDGSWNVTIEDVQQAITLDVETSTGISLNITEPENGTITVTRGNDTLQNGDELREGDELTITAEPDTGYRLSRLTVNGTAFTSGQTLTVGGDMTVVTVQASFEQENTGGGSTGGGGGGSTGGGGGGGAGGGGGGGSSSGGSGSSSSATYVPSVDAGRNGDVTVSPSRPSSGQTVTITVDPDAGYELDDLTVTDAKGNVVKVTDNGDGTYSFTQPSSNVTIEVTFAEIQEEPALAFTDVTERDYYYDAVLWAVENGITSGTTAATFSPDADVSRAQMVTFLWRAAGSPEPQSSVNPFTDISSSAYYYDAVLWAVENGITSGTSATTFGPESAVSRAQAVTFLWRSANAPAASDVSFDDVADEAYYAQAVSWAAQEGITSGTGGNNFSPDQIVSRAQAVTFLYRQLG